MNKRILELADQATIQEGSHGAFGEPTVNEYVDLEKFAELIVRECANYVQFYYKDHACEMIAHDMKHHFGVE